MNLILNLVVHYTTDDDGIHLWCDECGWSEVVGHTPSVAEVIEAAAHHSQDQCKSPSTE
jgi:hypothetical protein